jgi:hypothetical protein
MLLNNLSKLLTIEKVDRLVNILIVSPLLHLIQNDWAKFSIVALILGVIIVIKNILMVLVTFSKKTSIKNRSAYVLWKLINSLIVIPISYMQFKYESFTQHNYWIEAVTVFYNMLKMATGSSNVNSTGIATEVTNPDLDNQVSIIESIGSTSVTLVAKKIKIKNKKKYCSPCSSDGKLSLEISSYCSSSIPQKKTKKTKKTKNTKKTKKTKMSKKEIDYFLRTYNIIDH